MGLGRASQCVTKGAQSMRVGMRQGCIAPVRDGMESTERGGGHSSLWESGV